MALEVNQPSREVNAMSQHWPIVEALRGGTSAMRAAGAAFLPKFQNEEPDAYKARLNASTLFPALSRTVSVMVGKPFSKQMTLGDDVPPRIVELADDCDMQGNNLHAFCATLMDEVLSYGFAGVLVDYPKVGPEVRTVAEERSLGVRPYLVFIRHNQILGWKCARVAGATVLTQLRIAETAEVEDGMFGTAVRNRVRVIQPTTWELYEEREQADGKREWVSVEKGVNTLGRIAFTPFYGKKLGFMHGVSPLLDLAYLNVKHWQSQSDQDNILHVARVPILAMIGADDNSVLTVGGSAAVKLPLGASLTFVEHSGAAIAAGERALEKLEEQMVQTGAELLVVKPGEQKSATQSNNDAEANKCDLQRIVETFEDSVDQVLHHMALWLKLDAGGHASLFKDFAAGSLSDASMQIVHALQQGGVITKRRVITEAQRRSVLAADVDPDKELEEVAEEGPALGVIGEPGQGFPPAAGGAANGGE